jgi:glycosyltransferase involved in cell wall biosynthesis
MKKVLILCVHRPGRSPSQRYRFEQYLDYLSQHGYNFDFSYLVNEKDDNIYYGPGEYFGKLRILLNSLRRRTREMMKAKDYDLVFVQREAVMLGTAYFEKRISHKVFMIFDFDDSIWLQTVSEGNKKLAFLKDASKTAKIITASSLVLAGNAFLARYARRFNSNVVVVPTTINTDVYQKVPWPDQGSVCIGWSGSVTTIEHFATAIPALVRIKDKYGTKVRFKIIGDKNYYCKQLQTQGLPWVGSTEVKDLSEFDIGIMPLPDTEWAKGKCGLKGLQYMALGIASLMSPVGVNKDIIQIGENGYLPATEDEWVECLSLLIENEELRRRIGEAGKRTVEERFSVHVWKEKYLSLFNLAVESGVFKFGTTEK